MGGQVGDTGELNCNGEHLARSRTRRRAGTRGASSRGRRAAAGRRGSVACELIAPRRRAIERHHTVTHLLHWALHEVVSRDAAQKGSYVGPEKLTFDFNSAALTPEQVREVEKLVNERIVGERERLLDRDALRGGESARRISCSSSATNTATPCAWCRSAASRARSMATPWSFAAARICVARARSGSSGL